MEKKCWICGKSANSAEHRIKKSDITRIYGKGPYKGDNAPVHVKEGKQTDIQGPNSKGLKYEKSLCYYCNTTRTQPYDVAYEQMIEWILNNENIVIERRWIDFIEVYGNDWETKQRHLFKYYIKSFGCRIYNSGYTVPFDLRYLFSKRRFHTAVSLSFAINMDIFQLPKEDRDGFISKGDLICGERKGFFKQFRPYRWYEKVSWFYVFYWYNLVPDGPYGSQWIANTRYVYLGTFLPLNNEQRSELECRLKERED